MKNLVSTIIVGVFLVTSCSTNAQYSGPNSSKANYSVKEVLANGSSLDKKDVVVLLKGYVVEKVNSEDFWFKDDSGKILIEIESKHFPTFQFNEKSLVEIEGEVDHDALEGTEIEVISIKLSK